VHGGGGSAQGTAGSHHKMQQVQLITKQRPGRCSLGQQQLACSSWSLACLAAAAAYARQQTAAELGCIGAVEEWLALHVGHRWGP
jgi:hypothetical protein